MNKHDRHRIVWKTLSAVCGPWFRGIFRYTHDSCVLENPALIISNHVTNFDPILVALSFPRKPVYFVASEHLFRKGLVTALLRSLFDPIARKKGSSGMDTAMTSMRRLRDGHSVCIFGEGETTWNGLSVDIFPATGTLAKVGRTELITYRLEGGYLTAPRWGKGIRRGGMRGRIVNRYSPEQLRAMSPEEITAAINRDLYEDAWIRQQETPLRYRGRKRAENIETALFMCPKCKSIGTVFGKGNRVLCRCGLDLLYNEYGAFEPADTFDNIAQWDAWQHERLKAGDYNCEGSDFSDDGVSLIRVDAEHREQVIAKGRLSLENGMLKIDAQAFDLKQITNLALVQTRMIVFSVGADYYELRSDKPRCLRKYLAAWKFANAQE